MLRFRVLCDLPVGQ